MGAFRSRNTLSSKRKLLVIGASGLLGSRLFFQAAGEYEVYGTYNPEVDGKSFSHNYLSHYPSSSQSGRPPATAARIVLTAYEGFGMPMRSQAQ